MNSAWGVVPDSTRAILSLHGRMSFLLVQKKRAIRWANTAPYMRNSGSLMLSMLTCVACRPKPGVSETRLVLALLVLRMRLSSCSASQGGTVICVARIRNIRAKSYLLNRLYPVTHWVEQFETSAWRGDSKHDQWSMMCTLAHQSTGKHASSCHFTMTRLPSIVSFVLRLWVDVYISLANQPSGP